MTSLRVSTLVKVGKSSPLLLVYTSGSLQGSNETDDIDTNIFKLQSTVTWKTVTVIQQKQRTAAGHCGQPMFIIVPFITAPRLHLKVYFFLTGSFLGMVNPSRHIALSKPVESQEAPSAKSFCWWPGGDMWPETGQSGASSLKCPSWAEWKSHSSSRTLTGPPFLLEDHFWAPVSA